MNVLPKACAMMLCMASAAGSHAIGQSVFIRANQLGYSERDVKNAVLLSRKDLHGQTFDIIHTGGGEPVHHGMIGRSVGRYGNFGYVYQIDFSAVAEPGTFVVRALGQESAPFVIGDGLYTRVIDSLMLFFRIQRCGSTQSFMHRPCHTYDATRLIGWSKSEDHHVDATGGWHDAGDYVKFLNTTAYTSYTLLFAYEFSPEDFGSDRDGNGIPDVLDEARIGLDWLLKLPIDERHVITQIQDLRDHDQEWRLPEHDELARDRPAFVGGGKNLAGIYCAAMAAGARIWAALDQSFADRCLTAAENVYSVRQELSDLDSSGTGMYRDVQYAGKLALAAVELYISTKHPEYLEQAKRYATLAGSDYWWSWGDLNSYAHYRLGQWDKKFLKYLRNNLVASRALSRAHVFGEASNGRWGSTNAILGAALQAALWKRLTGETTFDTLAASQRDYVFGRNPWGISFFYGIGTTFARHFHSQVASINGGYLPGGLAAGPVTAATLSQYPIALERPDALAAFQDLEAVFHDDRMDYVTNEPTITAAATAVFVMGVQAYRYPLHGGH